MGYYLNLVNHKQKIVQECCKSGKDDMAAYFDNGSQERLVPMFLQYCDDNNLKVDIVHDLMLSDKCFGYSDFEDTRYVKSFASSDKEDSR